MRFLLLVAQVAVLVAGLKSRRIRHTYPLFLGSLLFSLVLIFTYDAREPVWQTYWWVPLECGAVLLRMAASLEAIAEQRIRGLLLACAVIAMFDVSLCRILLGHSLLISTGQAVTAVEIFYSCALITAILVPRRNGRRRGFHIVLLCLATLPGTVANTIWLAFRLSSLQWDVARRWSWGLTAFAYGLWVLATLVNESLQFATLPIESRDSFID